MDPLFRWGGRGRSHMCERVYAITQTHTRSRARPHPRPANEPRGLARRRLRRRRPPSALLARPLYFAADRDFPTRSVC